MFTASLDFVDQFFGAGDSGVLTNGVVDHEVAGEWDSLSVDLTVSSLVNQLGNGLSVWNSVGDPWLDDSEHVHGGLVVLEEDSVVDLSQSEESQNLLWFWGDGVDTLHSDDEENLRFGWDIDGSIFLSLY